MPPPYSRERKITPKFFCTSWGHGRPCIRVTDVRTQMLVFPGFRGPPRSFWPRTSARMTPGRLRDILGEAKPGGSKPGGGFPTCFGKGPDCVADPFGIGAVDGPRERKRTDLENPRTILDKSGKSRKNRESPKKDKKGRRSPDRETTPFLAALEKTSGLSCFFCSWKFARVIEALAEALWMASSLWQLRKTLMGGPCPEIGHIAVLRWPGDSQRESGRFARIDSQTNPYFSNVLAIRANHFKPAIRDF